MMRSLLQRDKQIIYKNKIWLQGKTLQPNLIYNQAEISALIKTLYDFFVFDKMSSCGVYGC